MEAIKYQVLDEGKHIAASKKKFVWTFKLHGQEYSLSLTVSYNSKKYSIVLNGDVQVYRARRSNEKDAFRFEFSLDNEKVIVTEKDKRADLLFRERNFHNYLTHSLVHMTQSPIPHSPQIVILAVNTPLGTSERPPVVPGRAVNRAQSPSNKVGRSGDTPLASEQTQMGYPDLGNFRTSRVIRIDGTCGFESRADVFGEVTFPEESVQAEAIFKLVHTRG